MKCDVHGVDGCESQGCAIWKEGESMNVEELIDKIYRIEFDDYEKAKAEILRRFAELGELAGIHDFQDAEVHEKFKTEIRQGIYIQSAETL